MPQITVFFIHVKPSVDCQYHMQHALMTVISPLLHPPSANVQEVYARVD